MYPVNVVALLPHAVAIDVRAARVKTRNLRFMVPPNSFTTAFLKPSNLNLISFCVASRQFVHYIALVPGKSRLVLALYRMRE
jgi:hypothetical protein